ncbi:MAG: DNA-3-methyladenine glycosylase [Anaerolineaceae bacterium]
MDSNSHVVPRDQEGTKPEILRFAQNDHQPAESLPLIDINDKKMILDETTYPLAINALCQADPDLARIHDQYGPPPLWAREPGFATLVKIILEQQVSLGSAQAAYDKLTALISPLTPKNLLKLDDAALKDCGFSRQKAGYARGLAEDILSGRLDLAAISAMDDQTAQTELTRVRGIGPWSANIFLLMALLRADIWPQGDLALIQSLRRVKNLPSLPSPQEFEEIGQIWRPWRAVAARFLWHDYLSHAAGD